MNLTPLPLAGAFLVEPTVHRDHRGLFFESWNRSILEQSGIVVDFSQDNHSRSARRVLRGLHYQAGAAAQAKLVRVVQGVVFDVIVDLRRSSGTFGRWHGEVISEENRRQIFVPRGMAHGFLVLSESADCLYKCTGRRDPAAERILAWDDPDLGISWPLDGDRPIMSPKDQSSGVRWRECETFP